jgi:predicted DNA binding CopG/RHH family protein
MSLDAALKVRVTASDYAAIEAQARRERVPLSHIIREAMRKALADGKPLVRETH